VLISAERIISERLVLDPLGVDDAEEMAAVLGDEALYEFIGGTAPCLEGLREHYLLLTAGSAKADEIWLNWVVRSAVDDRAIGTLQATVSRRLEGHPYAELSWVIGTRWQEHGFATEAARSLVGWLKSKKVGDFAAHIHDCHHASAAVARHLGLAPTPLRRDGEVLWRNAGSL